MNTVDSVDKVPILSPAQGCVWPTPEAPQAGVIAVRRQTFLTARVGVLNLLSLASVGVLARPFRHAPLSPTSTDLTCCSVGIGGPNPPSFAVVFLSYFD